MTIDTKLGKRIGTATVMAALVAIIFAAVYSSATSVLPSRGDRAVSRLNAPMPPNGYNVHAYDAGKHHLGYSSVMLDVGTHDEATGTRRDPAEYKASILAASCQCAAEGKDLPEESKSPEYQKFCSGKSRLWCVRDYAAKSGLDPLEDYDQIKEYCDPYVKHQAERFVTLVTSLDEIPSNVDDDHLYCACEGHDSELPKRDPEPGPCTNRVNCRLLTPATPQARIN